MASKIGFFRSTVADLINFNPEEQTSWRKNEPQAPSTRQMIKEIVEMRRTWDSQKDHCDGLVDRKRKLIKQQLEVEFFYHCNVEEEHGLQRRDEIQRLLRTSDDVSKGNESLTFEEQETVNLRDAYLYLKSENESVDTMYRGLLEESMLRQVNKIILRNIPRQNYYTKPGTYSNNARVTQFKGETYYYQHPQDMQEAVSLLLDRYNSLFTDSMSKTDEVEKLQSIFKTVSWLVFELLDLHPFSDGNGRLCRLLCSYVLFTCTPFPSPIYNMHSESSKDDFINALVDARKSESRHPCELATMIIESNWASWKSLLQNNPFVDNQKSHDPSREDLQSSEVYVNSPKSHDIITDACPENTLSLEHSQADNDHVAHTHLIASCA